jgi:type IV fimbrial biogenesis protein FimT
MLGRQQGRLLNMERQRGFSLIEMVVVVAIMGILLGLGLPSYRVYMANQKVQSVAEVFMAGVQMARGEAVKRNQRVEFILTNDDPISANVDTTNTNIAGRNWIVRALVPVTGVSANTFIEGKSGAEGTGSATSAASPIAISSSVANVVFDGFGMPVGLTATATFDFANPAAGSCAGDTPPGPVRCLRVRLSRGGQARLCDPSVAATDTRSCGT